MRLPRAARAASAVVLLACPPRSAAMGRAPADERCELGQEVVGGRAEPAAKVQVVAPRKSAWEASLGGQAAAKPFVIARLRGWPHRKLVDRAELPADDRGFLELLARDTWRGLDAFTDRPSGLPIDHVRFAAGDVSPEGARVGDYTNVTTVGLTLLSLAGAVELGLVPEAQAEARLTRLFDTLDRLETNRGFFFNYYDTTSLERTSNLLSFVDSSWLTAGLVVVRARFPSLASRAGRLVEQQDFGLFYDPELGRMRHGWWVQLDGPSVLHYGILYAESRLGSLLAIGKGDVPAEHWYGMVRTFPAACRWQRSTPLGREPKRTAGHDHWGGWYEAWGERYVPSWGGSAFEALMPLLVLDEPALVPESLGRNDRAHVAVQRRYAAEALGYPVWGLSSSSVPGTPLAYSEYGVPELGTLGYPAGAITPHASALALAVEPEAAARNLRSLAERYDLYGDYGLYDAVDPKSGAVALSYLTLDQAMTFVALANHLTGGSIQRLFAADPLVARGLDAVRPERFFE